MSLPAAFLSYVNADDHFQRISELRKRLSDEVRMQTGDAFPIFQDRNDLEWGQNWAERIDKAIGEEVTFFIPIITPSFFKSDACRKELTIFLEREKALGRNDLILPLYYVKTRLIDDEKSRKEDALAEAIAQHQWRDWRPLRHEEFTFPNVGKALEMLGSHIVQAIERLNSSPVTPKPAPAAVNSLQAIIEHIQTKSAQEENSSRANISIERNEPPTHVVDQMGRGNFITIRKAITAAKNGDRILVRPGLYKEALVVRKVLEIIGEGSVKDIVVESRSKTVLSFQAAFGRVANLTLRQTGGEDCFGVDMRQGRLELEGCDISSQGFCCVSIQDSADPRLRRNRIHDSKSSGVFIFNNGQGTLEDNDIFNNAYAGVEISEGGNPTLRRNQIHDNIYSGAVILDDGQGTLEDNDIFGNNRFGVEIRTNSDPLLLRNRIHNNVEHGIVITEEGHGIVENNNVVSNGGNGIVTMGNSNPVVTSNHINKNQGLAVLAITQGGGVFKDNNLSDNVSGAWGISESSEPNLKQERNKE